MKKQRDDSDARFARIVTTDEDADTHGFFWCGGFSWTARDYRCVLTAFPSPPKPRKNGAAIEVRGDTPEELAQAIAAREMVPPSVEEIRQWCESAGSSPPRPRGRK